MSLEERGEAAIINIVGNVDLSQIARLGQALDIPQLGKAGELEPEEESEP